MRKLNFVALTICLAAPVLSFQVARAHDRQAQEQSPSFLNYGLDGLVLGGLSGLSIGFLATGPKYESHEWKKLVLGAGIGALVGMGAGITLAVVDSNTQGPPTGSIILSDTWYGCLLGGAAGAVIGALVLISSDRPRDVLTGAAIGALSGDGVGLAFGIYESISKRRRYFARYEPEYTSVAITVSALPASDGSLSFIPTLLGRF